jgi:ABC-2 type transport system permease protein
MSRLFRIAWRDYLAYVRTPGFWLSIILMPVGMIIFGAAPIMLQRSTPAPVVAVVDLTGGDFQTDIGKAFQPTPPRQVVVGRLVPAPGGPYASPEAAVAGLKPYVTGERGVTPRPWLDAFAVIKRTPAGVSVDVWSRNVADPSLETSIKHAVADALRRDALKRAGVDPRALAAIDRITPDVQLYSAKAGGAVSLRDRLPGLAGFAMGILLWMVVFTGAGMLLNSVIEEKSSRILEVLLSSASVPQIMAGKILGVAAVTATVLAVWLTIGGTALAVRFPEVASDLAAILLAKGMIAYLLLYFVGGYLMFATLYVTVGAFCETTREAQTLLGPMMIVLSMPVLFMSQAITHPDAPLLSVLAWVPVFTPFMMAARAAVDPPLWQIAGTAAVMFATTALELWVAVPAFKSGALSTGRFEFRTFFASLARRGAD